MSEPILQVKGLQKKFPVFGSFGWMGGAKTYVNSVVNVNLSLYEGETYGLVGESGSGKTTTGRAILGLTPADAGQVLYRGIDLMGLDAKAFRKYRRELQFVFQDPFSSLNPRKRAGAILEEPLIVHRLGDAKIRQEKVFAMLETVGLQPEHYFRFPHEFSGGQRQRVGVARALIIDPKIVVCDEPVSALDVSIRAQILNLLVCLQKQMRLTLMFISHDISAVRHISNRVGVMYLGRIVEEAPTDSLFSRPSHPYTKALLSAVPDFSQNKLKNRTVLRGEIPSSTLKITGCPFHSRCPIAEDRCKIKPPAMRELTPRHFAACHFADD